MVKLSTNDLKAQHEEMRDIIIGLRETDADENLVHRLTYVNKFLHENMCISMLEKDEDGNYINDCDKKD